MIDKLTTLKPTPQLVQLLNRTRTNKMLSNLKIALTIFVILSCFSLSSCKQKPKTYWEIQDALMERKSDEQLIEDLYSKPQIYRVEYIIPPRGFTDEDPGGLGIKTGAVLVVIFNKNKLFVDKFGSLLGSYQTHYYSNSDGNLTADFNSNIPTNVGVGQVWGGGSRVNPQFYSNFITITQSYQATGNNRVYDLQMRYILKRLEP